MQYEHTIAVDFKFNEGGIDDPYAEDESEGNLLDISKINITQVHKIMFSRFQGSDCWHGKLITGKKTYLLNPVWVKHNFKPGYVHQCTSNIEKWQRIHAGAATQEKDFMCSPNARFGSHYGWNEQKIGPGWKEWVEHPR